MQDYGIANLPAGATEVLLQQYNGATWDTVKTIAEADADAAFELDVTQIDYLRFRWEFTISSVTYTGDYADVTTSCCEGDVAVPPAIPTAPVPVKDCANDKITFPVTLAAGVDSVEVARDDAPDTVIGTFTAPGTFVDLDVEYGTYKYRLRAKTGTLYSVWGAWSAAVSFISSTLTLTWLSPPAASTVHGKVLLKLSAAGTLTDLQLYVGNTLVSPGLESKGGGIYSLSYDTRRAVQGATTIEARAVGSDGCPAKATLNLTLDNTRADGVLYRDFLTDTQETGYQINRLPLLLYMGPLSDDPTAQYWGQLAITKETTIPIVTSETDPADAQAQFDAMQRFPLNSLKNGAMLANSQTVNNPAPQLKLRIRAERREWFTAYDTETERVAKIRSLGDGKYFIFAQNPDSVFTFADDTLTKEVDLGVAEDMTDVTDAAQVNDKIYFLNSGTLVAYDINPLTGARNRTLEFVIPREGRTAQFMEGIGTKLFVILTDATRDTDKTLCVSLQGDQMLDAWTLDDAATLAWSDGTDLYVGCGGDLYRAVGGTTAPVLLNSFGSAVVATDGTTAALADKSLWRYVAGSWVEVVTPGAHAVSAITTWYGSAESLNILWGNSSEIVLYGQSTSGSYDVHRALTNFDGETSTPTGISALARYFVPDDDVDPNSAQAQYKGDERAIIGTEGGLLMFLMVSRKTNAGAWLFTAIRDIESGAVPGIIPVEE